MARATIKIKLMPDSLEANLDEIKGKAEESIKDLYSKAEIRTSEEDIAFGLKAIILEFTWDDELSSDELEANLSKIEHVSSVEILDFQRAFG